MREPNKKRTLPINYLRKFRLARGLSLGEVAAILGFRSTSAVSRWERGLSLPDMQNLLRLSALYRTFADALYPEIASDLKKEVMEYERRVGAVARSFAARRGVEIESMRISSNFESISNPRRDA